MKLPGGKYPFLLTLMTILFGLSFIASKNALQGLGIFQLIFGRYIFALLIWMAVLWQRKKHFYIARRDWKQFLLLTLVEPVGYFIFETTGVRYTSPASVSLIIATIPVFSTLFALFLLKEKTTWAGIAGIVLSITGVYFIVSLQQASQLAPRPLLGSLLTLGAAMSAGIYNVLCRRLSRTYSPLTISYYQTVIATVVFLPLALVETFLRAETHLDGFILGNVLYLALGCSVLAYYLLNYTLSRLHASQVAVFSNLIPVVTILGSWFAYGELLKSAQLFGAVLIISGIYLTYVRGTEKPPAIPG